MSLHSTTYMISKSPMFTTENNMIYILLIVVNYLGISIAKECAIGESPTFARLKHVGGIPMGAADVLQSEIGIAECARLCVENVGATGEFFNCDAFDYFHDRHLCMLSLRDVNIDSAILKEDNDVDDFFNQPVRGREIDHISGFYQKICITDISYSQYQKDKIYTFDRYPNFLLLGATEKIISSPTIDICLSACLKSLEDFGFSCKSALFYLETNDCLLNSLSAHDPDAELSKNKEFRVDYYEIDMANTAGSAMCSVTFSVIADKSTITIYDNKIEDVSMQTCEAYCVANRNESGHQRQCDAYAFDQSARSCYLIGQNRHRNQLVNHIQVYEKLCVNEKELCIRSPTHAKIENFYLENDGNFIEDNVVSSVNECISMCGRDCLSINYFRDTGRCQLNARSRLIDVDLPRMISSTQSDYYDNLCSIERATGVDSNACLHAGDATYIEFEDAGTEAPSQKWVNDISVDTCLQSCETEKSFTCRASSYSDNICRLYSAWTQLATNQSSRHYERRCVKNSQSICGGVGVSFTGYLDKAVLLQPSLKIDGQNIDDCMNLCLQDPSRRCQAISYNKEALICHLYDQSATPSQLIDRSSIVYLKNLCAPLPPINTQHGAGQIHSLNQRQTNGNIDIETQCNMGYMKVVVTSQRPFTGYIFAKNRFSTCRTYASNSTNAILTLNYSPSTNLQIQSNAESKRNQLYDPANQAGKYLNSGNVDTIKNNWNPETENHLQEYKDDPIVVINRLREQIQEEMELMYNETMQFVYTEIDPLDNNSTINRVKRKSAYTQTMSGYHTNDVVDQLEAAYAFDNCGVIEMDNKYSVIIVVTNNNLGIPGLVTGTDRLYNLTCRYNAKTMTMARTALTVQNNARLIAQLQPDGQVYMPSPVEVHIERDGKRVSTVTVGDDMYLAFDYREAPVFDVFIRQCVAFDAKNHRAVDDGTYRHYDNLLLIDDGCPDNAVQGTIVRGGVERTNTGYRLPLKAFKFDGGRTVQINCSIDMCAGRCRTVKCDEKMRRRKERSLKSGANLIVNDDVDPILLYVRNRTDHNQRVTAKVASTVFRVVDNNQINIENKGINWLNSERNDSPINDDAFSKLQNQYYENEYELCMDMKKIIITIFAIFSIALIEISFSSYYIYKRIQLRWRFTCQ